MKLFVPGHVGGTPTPHTPHMPQRYFILPPAEVFTSGRHGLYIGEFGSYSHYNYLRGGLVSRIKRGHFETALRLAKARFGSDAIDVGCADGILLPSLSKHFRRVTAVDVRPEFIHVAEDLVQTMRLGNVTPLCNSDLSFDQLRQKIEIPSDVAFVLETLEHIGTPGGADVYEEKIKFLEGVFSLLKADGIIVASVPRTVGIGFACQYGMQRLLGMKVEPMSIREVIHSGIWKNTDQLEKRWASGHVGFNDEKFARLLRAKFKMNREKTSLANRFFVLGRR
jgi:2-polyprenyl-3-methyl-5-hydroxy-6-metoxy-1,4-benzoquinol methylase